MIFRIVFIGLWLFFTAIRMPYMKRYKTTEKKQTVRPGFEKFLVFINFIGMGFVPLFFAIYPMNDLFALSVSGSVRIFSAVILALSLVLFFVVHKSLGDNWSPVLEIRKNHGLVKTGIYRFIRHPMYLQIWIWVVFQGILLDNWMVEVYGVFAWALLYFIRVPREEIMLVNTFGQAYKDYISETGRVFPNVFKLFCVRCSNF